MNRLRIGLLPCVLFFGACDAPMQAPPPTDNTLPPAPSATSTPPTVQIAAAYGRGVLKADPAMLPGCEPAVVNLHWDAGKRYPNVAAVEIHVIAPQETAGKLFAAGGAVGGAATGPWATPGLMFQLRDTSGKELDQVTLGGPKCH